jgi:penicillin amidase
MLFISVPEKYTEIKCNIPSETNIYTNIQGIPHIITDNDNSMFFALGYFQARERLWSLSQIRIICQGRLSEYYGKDFIDVDIFMRGFCLDNIAQKCYENADNYTKECLRYYSDGINKYIKDNEGKLPVEFAAVGFVPDRWQPKDCFLLLRYWSFILSNNIYSDITTSNIVNKLGLNALELFPKYSTDAPYILDEAIIPIKEDTIIDTTFIDNDITNNYENIPNNEGIANTINKLYSILNRQGSNLGSNTWAINSMDGNVVLANDSHLPINLTHYWMQVHITSPSYNVMGMALPGIPIILVGRNDFISWGGANMLVDDIDYFVHKFKDERHMQYLYSDSIYKPIKNIIDTIKIKGELDSLYYKFIINGFPVLFDKKISDIKRNILFPSSNKIKTTGNYLTYNWTGNHISNEIGSMLKVMRAENWQEFLDGINGWNSPGLVFSYADIKGNIGIAPRALIPLRVQGLEPRIVNPYWKYQNAWFGFIKPSQLPTSYNPPKKFIVAANNGVFRDTTKYIASSFALEERTKRLHILLNNVTQYSYRDAQIMQKDIVSTYAKEIIKKLKHILKKYQYLFNENENKAYYKLLNWDYAMNMNSTTTSIFNMFLSKMLKNTFADELDELYESYVYNPNVPMRKLLQLCSVPNSIWFDNIKTKDKIEWLNYIVITSFKEAIQELSKLYETNNTDKWHYGKFHVANLTRDFNYYYTLNTITNIGSYSVDGGISTINCAEWNLLKPFGVVVSSTMRFIADMNSDNCYTIILGGVSEYAININYADQVKLFNIGAYNTLSINRIPNERFSLSVKLVRK